MIIKKKIVVLSAVVFIGILLLVVQFTEIFFTKDKSAEDELDATLVCFSEACIKAEIAETLSERTRGLMFREALAEDEGMLFVFQKEESRSFWMKNMHISLDIIWIDREFRIVHIEQAAPCASETCTLYKPNEPAQYVVEVKAGFVDKNNIHIGDMINISYN